MEYKELEIAKGTRLNGRYKVDVSRVFPLSDLDIPGVDFNLAKLAIKSGKNSPVFWLENTRLPCPETYYDRANYTIPKVVRRCAINVESNMPVFTERILPINYALRLKADITEMGGYTASFLEPITCAVKFPRLGRFNEDCFKILRVMADDYVKKDALGIAISFDHLVWRAQVLDEDEHEWKNSPTVWFYKSGDMVGFGALQFGGNDGLRIGHDFYCASRTAIGIRDRLMGKGVITATYI
ncbi:MAG: hypothetical protein NT129_03205 [Candidatus Aenigmarchaeota archaeon]|nr:hypothetical protein [Candidatus Aenigmarchaeota archaeon]